MNEIKRWSPMNRKHLFLVLAASLAIIAAGLAFGAACRRPSRRRESLSIKGLRAVDRGLAQQLYNTYCANCHGKNGDGRGRYADIFEQAPTNFRMGLYKFKHTATGQPPTDEDVFRTLTLGARGTGMVPQLHLSPAERLGLARYVKSFAPWSATAQDVKPLQLPPRPTGNLDLLAIGREWYTKAGCPLCHGPGGKGDGPSAETLTTPDGRPVVMPDLTRVPYKQGEDVKDIAWVIFTGREGTPMPSYQRVLTPEQLWGIATYVKTLQVGRKPRAMMGLIGEEVKAMRIDMEAVMAWRMGRMPMMRRMRRMRR